MKIKRHRFSNVILKWLNTEKPNTGKRDTLVIKSLSTGTSAMQGSKISLLSTLLLLIKFFIWELETVGYPKKCTTTATSTQPTSISAR